MAIYEITSDQIKKLGETTFGKEKIKEREDLQRLLRENIDVISPDTLVLDDEFSDWQDSKRRVDILALDKNANLVVIELKRTEDGGHMELQAIRYAAMVSTLTFERAVEIHDRYLSKYGHEGDAQTKILKFLGWEEADDERFAQDVRIILASGDFSKELTTSVMWLNNRDMDIKCVRIKPYSDGGRVLIDVQQVIPLPEAEDYQVKVREKEQQKRSTLTKERHILRFRFWEGLLNYAKTKTKLHENRSPTRYHWVGGGSGISGIHLNYLLRTDDSGVQLYIDGKNAEETKKVFDSFLKHKDEIEKVFGNPLTWKDEEGNRSCSIYHTILNSGFRSDESKWPDLYVEMVDAMINLEKAFRPHLDKLKYK
jgi:hypothetical protein